MGFFPSASYSFSLQVLYCGAYKLQTSCVQDHHAYERERTAMPNETRSVHRTRTCARQAGTQFALDLKWRSMRRPEVISLTTSRTMGSASSIERGSVDFSPTGAKRGKSVSRKSTKKGSVDQKPPRRRWDLSCLVLRPPIPSQENTHITPSCRFLDSLGHLMLRFPVPSFTATTRVLASPTRTLFAQLIAFARIATATL
jgi:hypothetical protein